MTKKSQIDEVVLTETSYNQTIQKENQRENCGRSIERKENTYQGLPSPSIRLPKSLAETSGQRTVGWYSKSTKTEQNNKPQDTSLLVLILSSISFTQLVSFASEVDIHIPKILASSFRSVWVFFGDFISIFMS